MWQQRGEPLRALASLDAAAKLSPGDAKLSLLRMEVLAAANRPDQAIAEGKTLLNHPQVGPQALAVVALAKVKKKDASADADFAEAVKTSKSIDQLLYVVAQLRLAYPAQVAEKLKQWQALRPDDWAVLKVLAELSQDLATQEKDAAKAKGYFNDAAGFLDKAMPLTKEPRDKAAVLRHMGLVHQLAGGLEQDAKARLEQSAKAYEECLKIEPDDGGTLNNVAWMLAKDLNRPDEALPYARRAVSLMPDNPDVLDTLGLTLILKGDLNEAEKALDKSIDIHPSASNLLHRGMILEKRNQKSDAARQYRMAWDFVKQSPQDANHKDVKEALKRVGEPVKD
jgi:tetratricopeptide (TPR) repeat protein